MKPFPLLVAAVLALAAGSGAAYLSGVHVGRADEQHQTYLVAQRARIDSLRVARLVQDSLDRELRDATRRRDSAAAAQQVKRQAFRIVTDTTILVVGDTTTYRLPPAVISYVRGEDAKVRVDTLWLHAVAADTMAIAHERDLWRNRALADEVEMQRARPRFGVKTGIALGVTVTLALVKAAAAIVR